MSNLRRKVQAIQELKSRYYIGTSAAMSYLKSFDIVEKRPKELSDFINVILPDDAQYKGTPERIVGVSTIIDDMLQQLYKYATVDEEYYKSVLEEALYILRNGLKRGDPLYFSMNPLSFIYSPGRMEGTLKEEEGYREVRERSNVWFTLFFKKIFERVNKESTPSDEMLLRWTLIYLGDGLKRTNEKNGRIVDDSVKTFCEIPLSLYRGIKFDTALFKEGERTAIKLNEDLWVDYTTLLQRVGRDKVEKRLEYRRQIAIRYAEDTDSRSADEAIKNFRAELAAMKAVSTFSGEEIAPLHFLLLHILISERKFLDRYLGNL